jgi:hypothetical protein
VTIPTKSAFLAAYEKELDDSGGHDDDAESYMKAMIKTLNGEQCSTGCALCIKHAWHAIGMTGKPTIEALRRLEP